MPGKGKASDWKSFRDRSNIYDMVTIVSEQSYRAFEDILRELYEEHSPVGITEEGLIRRLAVLFWERDELCRYLQFKMGIRQSELNRQLPYAQSIAGIKSRANEIKFARIIEEGKKLLSEFDATAQEGDDAAPKESIPERDRNAKMSGNAFLEVIASLPDVGPTNGRDIFLKMVDEFPIIERLEQFEKIDVMIDRTIKRFMQVKTMKQMVRQAEPKLITRS
jgi:hypothetical protein